MYPLKIEQKGITFDHDFDYSFPLFSSLLKKSGKKKRRMNKQSRGKKACLSARSPLKENRCYIYGVNYPDI